MFILIGIVIILEVLVQGTCLDRGCGSVFVKDPLCRSRFAGHFSSLLTSIFLIDGWFRQSLASLN
jgi:hypothetical protein